jgi:DNA-binding transcriptional LysR family regulator
MQPEASRMRRKDRYQDIQLNQLRSFCLAALEGNFTATAKKLGLSVATVWEQVRALERKFQSTLLRRHGHAVEVTPEGRLLLELIQPCVGTLDSLERVFAAQRSELPQVLTVLSTGYLVSYHLVQPVQEFTAANPAVRLRLLANPWSQGMLQRLESGEAEIGVIYYSPDEPRHASVDYEDLFEMQLVLLTATAHPLARKKHLSMTDLVEYPLIGTPNEHYCHKVVNRLLQRHALQERAHFVLENNSLDVICKYVAAGTGIALLYTGPGKADRVPGVQQRVFDPTLDKMSAAIVVRKGSYLSGPAKSFRSIVRRFLGSGNGSR